MTAQSENFADLLEPGLYKIFNEQYKSLPSQISTLFSMDTSDKPYEKDSSLGAFSDFEEFNGTVNYDNVYQGYDKKYTFDAYAKGFKVERELFDDDLYNVINKKPKGMAIAARRTKEKAGASVFNEAFTTAPSDGDGKALCASDHPTNANSSTFDNTGTTSLSATSVESTRLLMRDFQNDRGEKIMANGDLILCAKNNEETAYEIINSKGKVDTADNNLNFHKGKYKLVVWDYLTDTDAWFMIDSSYMKLFLNWYDRIPLEFSQDKNSDTFLAKYVGYMRYGYGWSDWRFVYGHQPS